MINELGNVFYEAVVVQAYYLFSGGDRENYVQATWQQKTAATQYAHIRQERNAT
jgi:hypothetical protein